MAQQDREEKLVPRYCPFCDEEMETDDLPTCQVCGVSVFYCPQCRKPVPREHKVCPSCGAKIRMPSA